MRAHGSGRPSSAPATRWAVSGGSAKNSGRPTAEYQPIDRLCYRADGDRRDDDLVRRLVEASELHGDFVLSSGKRSTVYFDKFRFLTRPDLLRELAHEVAGLLPPGTDHLAAPEGAATLLVAAVSLETGLPVAVVRKEAKAYGTREQVEGHAPAGAKTVLIEDVSTTGHQVVGRRRPGHRASTSSGSCWRSTAAARTTSGRRATTSRPWRSSGRRIDRSTSPRRP